MSAVIRKDTPVATTMFSLADVSRAADEILAAARTQAQAAIAEAKRQALVQIQAQARQAYSRGFEEGRAAGAAAIEKESRATAIREQGAKLQQLQAALSGLIREIQQRRHSLVAEAESGLIRLALAIAERVCKRAVGRSSSVAEANAQALLAMIRDEPEIVLELGPADFEALSKTGSRGILESSSTRKIQIHAVTDIADGGCRVRTRLGVIDADIALQLDRIAAALLGDSVEVESHFVPADAAAASPSAATP